MKAPATAFADPAPTGGVSGGTVRTMTVTAQLLAASTTAPTLRTTARAYGADVTASFSTAAGRLIGTANPDSLLIQANEAINIIPNVRIFQNSRNTLVHATSRLVAAVGLDNVVVVETPDAVLVTTRADCAWSALGHATAGYDAALTYAKAMAYHLTGDQAFADSARQKILELSSAASRRTSCSRWEGESRGRVDTAMV